MSLIKWTPEFSVNHPEIDKEHQSLFEMLNRFYQGIQESSPKEKLAQLIKGLINYARTHFKHEEEYMRSIAYPGLLAHQKEHQEFMDKVNEFYEKYTNGRLILSIEVTNFIKNWITNHIKKEDKRYATFVGKEKNA
ncbi:bacteriohemerythrin [Thermophagus xiamenensis]|uniref:Hemerythrin n=1 Tax=Thermophagus xiamenensis TaxID=385682 RepID=A0A1I1UKT3_9BACT|nr:bacteriohemerythrin [Thermophagus xiamenensis]SFD69363.1 hemerythrin [Thermophagus xiamenensis]